MPEDEIAARLLLCERLLAAWPNARPLDRDATLREYVDATRGVPLEGQQLERVIGWCIRSGGDWLPPAGEVIRRAVEAAHGGKPIGTDRDEQYRFAKKTQKQIAAMSSARGTVLAITPGAEQTEQAFERVMDPMLPAGDRA